jgi:hypothetical protein
MNSHTIRRVPWTCEWGRFGVAVEELGDGGSRIDDVFWACHQLERSPEIRLTKRGECERCPFWMAAARLQPHS